MSKYEVIIYTEMTRELFDSLEEAEDCCEYENRVKGNKTDIIEVEDDEWKSVDIMVFIVIMR